MIDLVSYESETHKFPDTFYPNIADQLKVIQHQETIVQPVQRVSRDSLKSKLSFELNEANAAVNHF